MNKAITDTGPPLHLNQIDYVRLLEMFETILISGQVKEELQDFNTWYSLTKEETLHIQEETVNDIEISDEKNRWRDHKLHVADLSVLVLARRKVDTLILTDDLEVRKAIASLNRVVIGIVGVLIRGYR